MSVDDLAILSHLAREFKRNPSLRKFLTNLAGFMGAPHLGRRLQVRRLATASSRSSQAEDHDFLQPQKLKIVKLSPVT